MIARAMIVTLAALLPHTSMFAQKPEIERETRSVPFFVPTTDPAQWLEVGDGNYRAILPMQREYRHSSEPTKSDTSGLRKRPSEKQILEDLGVKMGKGATAKFQPYEGRLLVVNKPAQLQHLTKLALEWDWRGPGRQIAVRTEIYELSKLQVLQLSESAAAHADHKPERDSLLKEVRAGAAKLVAVNSLVTSPGQRALVGTVFGIEESNQSQTNLECEPNIDVDGRTMSLSIDLEHQTTERKIISTSLNLAEGGYRLLTTWSLGKKEEDSDRWQAAFVTADIQEIEER